MAVSLLFANVTEVQSIASVSYSISVDPPPGHTDNGKHKGHEKKAKANGYKRHQKNGTASSRRNAPVIKQAPPTVNFRLLGVPQIPKAKKPRPHKPKAKKSVKAVTKYVYVKVPVKSEPEVIVETDTVVDKVIYGAGVFLLALVGAGLLGLFAGFLHGWRRRGKHEIEQMKSLLDTTP